MFDLGSDYLLVSYMLSSSLHSGRVSEITFGQLSEEVGCCTYIIMIIVVYVYRHPDMW